ncbi:unnamed protein product [Protopolystoma xenopodis]|uniref:Uncharacterized protein n=1 Tax=Protopolystoma xenopodis TaxID=117903 RepID=A0A448WX61_9PLAT|nr:unnamed protein product [Protopolystoma xenopodis]
MRFVLACKKNERNRPREVTEDVIVCQFDWTAGSTPTKWLKPKPCAATGNTSSLCQATRNGCQRVTIFQRSLTVRQKCVWHRNRERMNDISLERNGWPRNSHQSSDDPLETVAV